MEMMDADIKLCSLAFQEYISRKRILELKLKMQQETNASMKNYIKTEIEKLRSNADELNSYRNTNCKKR